MLSHFARLVNGKRVPKLGEEYEILKIGGILFRVESFRIWIDIIRDDHGTWSKTAEEKSKNRCVSFPLIYL